MAASSEVTIKFSGDASALQDVLADIEDRLKAIEQRADRARRALERASESSEGSGAS